MMSSSRTNSERRLTAAGLINSLNAPKWFCVAEELATLSDKDFERLICAFSLMRQAVLNETRACDPKPIAKPKQGG